MRLPGSPNQPLPHLGAMLLMQQQKPQDTVGSGGAGAASASGNNPHCFRHGVVTLVPIFIVPDQVVDLPIRSSKLVKFAI